MEMLHWFYPPLSALNDPFVFPLRDHFVFIFSAAVETKRKNSQGSPSVTFTIELQRQTTYYIVILFLPCFSNVMLTLLVFLLPPETGERIGVGINTLLTMWVNYLRVGSSLLKTTLKFAFTPYNTFELRIPRKDVKQSEHALTKATWFGHHRMHTQNNHINHPSIGSHEQLFWRC